MDHDAGIAAGAAAGGLRRRRGGNGGSEHDHDGERAGTWFASWGDKVNANYVDALKGEPR